MLKLTLTLLIILLAYAAGFSYALMREFEEHDL
jgi:hypothetical protein